MSVLEERYGTITEYEYQQRKKREQEEKERQERAIQKEINSVLEKIKAEIESNMESIIGKYDSSIPKSNMPSYKIERNKARKECISIIDKYKAESEGKK